MSGIFGLLEQNTSSENRKQKLQKLALWNRAYGKDNQKIFQENRIGLGCCYEGLTKYASPVDLIQNVQGSYYVFDAVLYNREELCGKVSVASDLSDEELLVAYIRAHGLTSLRDVNGDFCGAIYDTASSSLTLFRDHMGIRPLYYYADASGISFSTDLRGILALPDTDLSVNEDWLYRTVSGYSALSLTQTEFSHIFCVPPGGYIRFSLEDTGFVKSEHSYWRLGRKKIRLSSEQAYISQLRQLITDSVQRRLNVIPGIVGAELSGGLDSGVIDLLIHRLGRECLYHSWSTDPEELPYAENDERFIIRDICEQENITCHFSKLKLDLDESSNIAKNMQAIGLPYDAEEHIAFRYVMSPSLNTLPICEASQYISDCGGRVVFTGHGGDEGVSHRCNPYEMFFAHEYYHYLRYQWSTTHGKRHRIYKTLKACYQNIWRDRAQYRKAFHNPFGSPELLSASFAANFREKDMPSLHFAFDPKGYISSGGSRNRLDVTAVLGTYSGVRYLFPYLDYRVIDFAVSIPRHFYLKGHQNRYLFREAFKDIMPASLYKLRTKSDNSLNSIKEDPDWFTKFDKERHEIVNRLDRKQWEKYLNFEVIDRWLKEGKPSDEERHHFESMYYCLFLCALFENLVEKTRDND